MRSVASKDVLRNKLLDPGPIAQGIDNHDAAQNQGWHLECKKYKAEHSCDYYNFI